MTINYQCKKWGAGSRLVKSRFAFIGIAVWALIACRSQAADDAPIGVGLVGIDHLADHLSVQYFSIDGYGGGQAGSGNRLVCCAVLPRHWRPGLVVKVHWNVSDWKNHVGHDYDAVVPIEPYPKAGRLYIHFLPDGTVRAISSDLPPRNPDYAGPHDPIPDKDPWNRYPQPW